MAMTFADFVQIELPKRPFAEVDGAPGQVLARSNRPERPRELVWVEIPGLSAPGNELELEAGEDLAANTPVKVNANKLYAASNTSDPRVLGVVKTAVSAGMLAKVVTGGRLDTSGLTPDATYYLGDGVITTTPPTSGYLIRLGVAATASVLLVEVGTPILLT